MILIPTLSFCITCKNRFHQISKTLPQNLDDNRLHLKWIEFVLVDFGSMDGLKEWILNNFRDHLQTGYLRYYYTDALPHWHASVAKNTAHRLSSNEILVNLDCDNYTGYLGGQFVIRQFLQKRDIVLQQFDGDRFGGSYGRISLLREYFDRIGGYDESLGPMAYQDLDLIKRLKMAGLEYRKESDNRFCQAIANTKKEGLRYTNTTVDYETMNQANKQISEDNLENGRIIANNGKYGIIDRLYNYKDKLTGKQMNCRYPSQKVLTNDILDSLIWQIAQLSGLSPCLGLYHGKTGLAVLLYHTSRCLRQPELAQIAGALLDDVLADSNRIHSFDFDDGLTGIAWGIHHLMVSGFVEFDDDFLEEVDHVLFEEDPFILMTGGLQYLMLGLYLDIRLKSSPASFLWKKRALTYCSHVTELLREYFPRNPCFLTPFLYCLSQWKGDAFADYINNDAFSIVTHTKTSVWFLSKLTGIELIMPWPRKWSLKDINCLFFDQLLYGDIPLPPGPLMNDAFSSILEDSQLLNSFHSSLNQQTVGLSEHVSGFVWSLLRFKDLNTSGAYNCNPNNV